MNEQFEKAIRVMQQHKCEEIALYGDEYNLAISALQEVQQYRSIGTIEEFREAVKEHGEKLKTLDDRTKDEIYRAVRADYVANDIKTHYFEDKGVEISDERADELAKIYVEGEYDCNLSYWTNIENLYNHH